MLANLSERDRRTLRFGGFAVGAILFLMLVGFPLMDYWDGVSRRVTDAEAKLRTIETNLNDAAGAVSALRSLRELATDVEPASLNQQTALMLQRVERLPAYGALTVARIEGLPMREEDSFYRTGVLLQFSGSLSDLHRFLQEVEAARPALKVDRLTLAMDQKNRARVEGQMVLVASVVVVGKGKSG